MFATVCGDTYPAGKDAPGQTPAGRLHRRRLAGGRPRFADHHAGGRPAQRLVRQPVHPQLRHPGGNLRADLPSCCGSCSEPSSRWSSLRLLKAAATWGISTMVAFVLGMGLYGCVYLIPRVPRATCRATARRSSAKRSSGSVVPQLLVFPIGAAVSDQESGHAWADLLSARLIFAYSCYHERPT